MSFECRLRIVAARRYGFVKDTTAAVVEPIRTHLLLGAVDKFHARMNAALNRSKVSFVVAGFNTVAVVVGIVPVGPMMSVMPVMPVFAAFIVAFMLPMASLLVIIGALLPALLGSINLLVDHLFEWTGCMASLCQRQCTQ
jgi:hypothetical protein